MKIVKTLEEYKAISVNAGREYHAVFGGTDNYAVEKMRAYQRATFNYHRACIEKARLSVPVSKGALFCG